MEKYEFKTNINCGGCVAKVTPHLSGNQKIKHWEVDTNNPKKILKVEAEGLSEAEVRSIVEEAGFKAESI